MLVGVLDITLHFFLLDCVLGEHICLVRYETMKGKEIHVVSHIMLYISKLAFLKAMWADEIKKTRCVF